MTERRHLLYRRRPAYARVSGVLGILFVIAGIALVATTGDGWADRRLPAGVLLLVGSSFFFWMSGVRVAADRDGVVVRNFVTTHRLPWSEIDRFVVPEVGYQTGWLERRDGTRVRISTFQTNVFHATRWDTRCPIEREVGVLNALLRERAPALT